MKLTSRIGGTKTVPEVKDQIIDVHLDYIEKDGYIWRYDEDIKKYYNTGICLMGKPGNSGPPGRKGDNGLSAYQIAKEHGFDGNVQAWLDSLKGKSAYEIAVENGFEGTEEEWLESLKGEDGIIGQDGVTPHIDSTTKHWMIGDEDSEIIAEGQDGADGKSAYQIWQEQPENENKNISEFLAWMKDTQAIHGPKYIGDESLIDTVNDRMTLFYVPSGTSYKVVFVDEGGGTHTLANRIGDITNYAGIYDVSADNELDGGILKTYASLPEAIADIDENAKKGGMTVKYIGTDGKYHQYRYMLANTDDEYFEDEDNWVGEPLMEETSNADLEFADNYSNVIGRFADGGIETKNFNSNKEQQNTGTVAFPPFDENDEYGIGDVVRHNGLLYRFIAVHSGEWDDDDVEQTSILNESKSPIRISDINGYDIAITDDNGYIVFGVKNGHAWTKYFRSDRFNPYTPDTIRFTVPVNVNFLRDSDNSLSLQDNITDGYEDNGLLMLPSTYTQCGEPTRLVIAFHGAGGGATDTDSQTEQEVAYKYLVANGYAVMDMNGMPDDWVETWWDDCPIENTNTKEYCKVNNMGSPLAMECYIKGYQWVIEHYNIARDGVFVCGGSMGGLSSSNFVLMGSVPVIAHAIYAPVLDTYNQAFLHPWTPIASPVLSKYCISKLYGFAKNNDEYVYNEDKVKGYNPIVNGMESYVNGERVTSVGLYDFSTHHLNNNEVTEYKHYPCPLKIWHCDDDGTVNIACSIRQINAIKNAGGMAWLRRFPSGGHAPNSAGNNVTNPSGNTTLNGVNIGTIKPFAEELLLYFNRFNNK